MKDKILKKLGSEKGASITFALLLFLVCSVLCSVIIASATAASGRMSRIAETDQRYYSVTSAAELLKDLINGKTVSYVTVENKWTTRTYTDGVAGDPSNAPTPDGETASQTYLKEGIVRSGDNYGTPLTGTVSFDSIPKDAAYRNAVKEEGVPAGSRKLKLGSSFSSTVGSDYDAYAVTAEESFDAAGNMTLILYNTYEKKDVNSTAGTKYSLEMNFGLSKSETKDSVSVDVKTGSSSVNAAGKVEYTVTTKTTTTKITTYTWNLTGIK